MGECRPEEEVTRPVVTYRDDVSLSFYSTRRKPRLCNSEKAVSPVNLADQVKALFCPVGTRRRPCSALYLFHLLRPIRCCLLHLLSFAYKPSGRRIFGLTGVSTMKIFMTRDVCGACFYTKQGQEPLLMLIVVLCSRHKALLMA